MKIVFWLSVSMVFYAYVGYIIILTIYNAYRVLFKVKINKANTLPIRNFKSKETIPYVSFIITVYNEEDRIRKKIENSISQDYPSERFEIIFASDCSNDRTDEIVMEYADKGVHLVRSSERKGKEYAQMHAVNVAQGSILVFSDVATILNPDAISLIVKNFQNSDVGCVSSEDRIIDRDGNVSGEGLYVKYEMFIRKLESQVNTLIGLSGSFFAARREVCHDWSPDLQSDFNTLLNSVKLGMRGISDPNSIGYYENISDENKEFQRKVRTVLRGIDVLMRNSQLLNIRRYRFFAWQLLSHKLCRWLVPFFLIIIFFSNFFLIGESLIYILFLLVQISLYSAALYYFIQLKRSKNAKIKWQLSAKKQKNILIKLIIKMLSSISKISYYFASVNISILIAWLKYFSGERSTFWEPSKRSI